MPLSAMASLGVKILAPTHLTGRKVRVPLEIFDRPAEEIFGSLKRIWNYNRGRV